LEQKIGSVDWDQREQQESGGITKVSMTFLFIDDDPEDTELFCEAISYLNDSDFIAGKEMIECLTINRGCNIVDLLTGLKELPRYIFLDINMPVMGGKECLKLLKQHEGFEKIPVIMLSTSFGESHVDEFRALGAHDCIQKPAGFNALVKMLSKYAYGAYL
jgi:CheY-like chemotaxis protein